MCYGGVEILPAWGIAKGRYNDQSAAHDVEARLSDGCEVDEIKKRHE
jgi:hypothetical protein